MKRHVHTVHVASTELYAGSNKFHKFVEVQGNGIYQKPSTCSVYVFLLHFPKYLMRMSAEYRQNIILNLNLLGLYLWQHHNKNL